jgi:hypothetical protein
LRRCGYAALLTALILAVLAGHVPSGFERIRRRVVVTPRVVSDPSLSLPIPNVQDLTGKHAAVILRVKAAGEPVAITMKFDDTRLADVIVRSESEIRVDASAFVAAGSGHRIVLDSNRPGWELRYLEVATVHGHSDQAGLSVIPRAAPVQRPLPVWLFVLAGAGLFVLALREKPPADPKWRRVWFGAAGVIGALFVLILAADSVSQFRIVLSLKMFLAAVAILYVDLMRTTAAAVWPYRRFAPHAVAIFLFFIGVSRYYEPATGFTSLIAIGTTFEPRFTGEFRSAPHYVHQNSGYDGQFYAQLALDPLLTDRETVSGIDDVAYRSRRMLIPAVAYVLGLGRPAWILQAYSLVNVIAWIAIGWLLLRWLPVGTMHAGLAWTACMLSNGLLASVRRSLPDGPSLVFLVIGIIAIEKNRHWLAAAICGLSGTARETNLLGGSMLGTPWPPKAARIRTWLAQAALVVLPLIAWSIYLHTRGLAPSPGAHNFSLPLVEYVLKWNSTVRELLARGWDGSYARITLLALVALTTQVLTLLWRRDWRSPWWRVGVAYVGLFLILGPAVWEGYPGAASRVLVPMTFAFNILLPRNAWFWPLLILGNVDILWGLEEIRAPGFTGD